MFGWLRKSRSTSGFAGPWGYWWLGLMNFRNFFITYVFGVKEYIFHSFTKLPCLDDFENPGQLPFLPVLEGTRTQSPVPSRTCKTGNWSVFSRLPEPCETTKNGLLDLENVENEEISKNHKTQSSVLLRTCKTGSWPGFSKSLEHSSFVKLREMDSLTSKT